MDNPDTIDIDVDVADKSTDLTPAEDKDVQADTAAAITEKNASKSKKNKKPTTQAKPAAKKVVKPEASIPRGQPKSNRPWKTPKQK